MADFKILKTTLNTLGKKIYIKSKDPFVAGEFAASIKNAEHLLNNYKIMYRNNPEIVKRLEIARALVNKAAEVIGKNAHNAAIFILKAANELPA